MVLMVVADTPPCMLWKASRWDAGCGLAPEPDSKFLERCLLTHKGFQDNQVPGKVRWFFDPLILNINEEWQNRASLSRMYPSVISRRLSQHIWLLLSRTMSLPAWRWDTVPQIFLKASKEDDLHNEVTTKPLCKSSPQASSVLQSKNISLKARKIGQYQQHVKCVISHFVFMAL